MPRAKKQWSVGFTLLELLVVIAIIAMATAGVGLALRDSSETALEREAQRLAVLFETARAQSRASGVPVTWRVTTTGFRFDGLPDGALPQNWLSAGVTVGAAAAVNLGPEPIIGPQTIDLTLQGKIWRLSTDGLQPFNALAAAQP